MLWKGILLVEHKSRGKDLDRAYQQAKDYFPGLKDRDTPRYILVSDFERFRLYDLEEDKQHDFTLKEFYKNIRLFGFIAGYQTTSFKEQDAVNIKAAERMGRLHDNLKAVGYEGHELEVYLVRLLFCLFAEDTSIFERSQFQELIEQSTAEDGRDLAQWLANLFEVLNTVHIVGIMSAIQLRQTNRLRSHNIDIKTQIYPGLNRLLRFACAWRIRARVGHHLWRKINLHLETF